MCGEERVEWAMFKQRSEHYRLRCIQLEKKLASQKEIRVSCVKQEQKKQTSLEEQLKEARSAIEVLKEDNKNLRAVNGRCIIDIKILQEMARTYQDQLNGYNRALRIADNTEKQYSALFMRICADPTAGPALEKYIDALPQSSSSKYFFGEKIK